tara:strand:+ start:122 stop:370 length:249 start_codon:yes stop_codon:yes gene_type:complete
MNIRPVDNNFFRFTSKYGKRKLVIEIDGDSTKDELCEAFTAFLNASGYSYTDRVECVTGDDPRDALAETYSNSDEYEEDIPF